MHAKKVIYEAFRAHKSEQCDYISDRDAVSTDAKTKGDNLEFTTPSVEATIFENDDGDWEKHKVYDTENDANRALEGFFVPAEVVEE